MAIRLIILFFEGTFVKLFQAKRAHKMFRVKFAGHSSNTSPTNGLMASSTKGTSFGMVMELAVRLTIVIKETSTIKRLAAVLKDKYSFSTNCLTYYKHHTHSNTFFLHTHFSFFKVKFLYFNSPQQIFKKLMLLYIKHVSS